MHASGAGGSRGSLSLVKETSKNKPKTLKKMVIGTYISITTLNVNGLNVPTKIHRLAEWIQKKKKKRHIYAIFKGPTSDLGTHTDSNWGDGKRYSIQMEAKRKLE